MKILFFTRRFYPDIGGVEKHVFEISKRLVTMGHTVSVVSEGSYNSQVLSFQKNNKIKLYKINVGRDKKKKKFIIWKWLLKNKKLIKDADIIHYHDVFFWYFPFRFLFPTKPVFTTFHGYEGYPINKRAILIRKLSEKLSWGNICIGDFMKKWYGTKPTYVSYGAVDVPGIKDLRIKIKDKESALFLGRLDQQTGIQEYIKAYEILKDKYPTFDLLVIGDGEYKKQVAKKVKTLGFQKNPERYFKNFRFAFVSRYLSILEAFAARRLVIASFDNPIKEDYLKMAPYAKFMVIEKKPEDLAKKVEEFMKDPKKEEKMVDSAYKWVEKNSWEKMINLYMKLWRASIS